MVDVIVAVVNVFRSQPDLITDFSTFLPDGYVVEQHSGVVTVSTLKRTATVQL
jgi:histone deacetylase complex regulatory component SIN3